jgi:hypothetical protein
LVAAGSALRFTAVQPTVDVPGPRPHLRVVHVSAALLYDAQTLTLTCVQTEQIAFGVPRVLRAGRPTAGTS